MRKAKTWVRGSKRKRGRPTHEPTSFVILNETPGKLLLKLFPMMLIGVFLMYWTSGSVESWYLLRYHAVETEGSVVKTWKPSGKNTSTHVEYRYETPEGPRVAVETLVTEAVSDYQSGYPVGIVYVAGRPGLSRIEGNLESASVAVMTGFTLLWNLSVFGVAAYALSLLIRRRGQDPG
jgi:hypothetical protein